MPNARLREIYLAMVRARTLARALRGRGAKSTVGLEACLTSPAVDLGPGDLVSDALAGGVVEFLRGATLGAVLRPGKALRGRSVTANCGSAGRLPAAAGAAERVWSTLGAAVALKVEAARAKVEARADAEATAKQPGVVVMYVLPGEMPEAVWRKALTFARENELPVVFVVLPMAQAQSGKPHGAKMGQVTAIALRCGLPGIPVDADDAVAIYRVAQESIGHARTGGGAAVMECVPFVLKGAAGTRAAADAISGLEEYMLRRRVATRAWMEREAKSFAKRVATGKLASK